MQIVKECRLKHGYSRNQLAELMHISLSSYDKVEFNQRKPTATFLREFKRVFPDVDMNIFFADSNHNT